MGWAAELVGVGVEILAHVPGVGAAANKAVALTSDAIITRKRPQRLSWFYLISETAKKAA